jgi:hypothetical protein
LAGFSHTLVGGAAAIHICTLLATWMSPLQEADDKLVKRVKRYMTKELAGDLGGCILDLCVAQL